MSVVVLQDKWTALMVAAENDNEEAVGFLLDNGADVNSRDIVSANCDSMSTLIFVFIYNRCLTRVLCPRYVS